MNEKKIGKKTIIIGVVALVVAAAIAIGLLLTGKEDKKETVKEPSSNVVVNKGENNVTSEEIIVEEEKTEDKKEDSTQKVKKDTYTITFYDENGKTVLQTSEVKAGSTPKYDGALPTKQETISHTFTFAGWDKEIATATEDANYKATYKATEKRKYIVTFYDSDQQTVISKKVVYEGQMPTYNGETPTKGETESTTYEFSGWDKKFNFITADTNYYAKYTATEKPQYSATFYDEDGTVLQTAKKYYEGQTPEYLGVTPTKERDDFHYYTFDAKKDWEPKLSAIKTDTKYVAKYQVHDDKTNVQDIVINAQELNEFGYLDYDRKVINIFPESGSTATLKKSGLVYKAASSMTIPDFFIGKHKEGHNIIPKEAKDTEEFYVIALGIQEYRHPTSGNIGYKFGDWFIATRETGTVEVDRFYDNDLVPEKKYCIVGIDNGTFYNNTNLEVIALPNTIKSIGSKAFCGCTNLARIIFNGTMAQWNKIDKGSEWDASTYEYVVQCTDGDIKKDITTLGIIEFDDSKAISYRYLVDHKSELSSIYNFNVDRVLPNSIGESAFAKQDSKETRVTRFVMPNNITTLGNNAFNGAAKLNNITISAGLSSISQSAFENCTSLTVVEMPASITDIESRAFAYCLSLSKINYGGTKAQWNAVTKKANWNVGTGTYIVHCSDGEIEEKGRETLTMMIRSFLGMSPVPTQNGVKNEDTQTKSNALPPTSTVNNSNDVSINSIKDSKSATNINESTSVTSKATTDTNSKDAFSIKSGNKQQVGYSEDESKLTIKTTFTGDGENGTEKGEKYTVKTIGSKAFADCENLTEVVIPEGIEAIEKDAFRGCSKLTKITIPTSVKSIGDDVFYNCSKLTNIVYNGSTTDWNNISKWKNWNSGTVAYTIQCTDGTISK